MSKIKKIIFIPPNGEIFINDFSIQRIAKYFKNNKNVHTTLLQIKDYKATDSFEYIDSVINVKSQDALLEQLKALKYDIIFHRSWMLAYPFAAKLVKEFDNVVVNIKDWNFSTKKEYKVLFGEAALEDFKAIKYIFKNAKYILSHFTKEQVKIWTKKYHVKAKKFIFFPEYCNENKFYNREKIKYTQAKLVFAGSLGPSSYPEDFFVAKVHLRAIKKITTLGINVSYVLTEGAYAATQLPKQRILFQDLLYENKFNNRFHLRKGKALDASVLKEYHFGFFNLEYTTKFQNLNKYTVPSKFAFYLEAGIPMIINHNLKSLSRIVKKHNIGIIISNNDIQYLDKILNSISFKDYHKMILNVKEFRKKFTDKKNIKQLMFLN